MAKRLVITEVQNGFTVDMADYYHQEGMVREEPWVFETVEALTDFVNTWHVKVEKHIRSETNATS